MVANIGLRRRFGIVAAMAILLPRASFGQETPLKATPQKPLQIEKVPDAVRAATISAEGNQAAARINALQAKENADLQAEVAGRQFWTGVATAFAGLIAAGLTFKKIKEDSANTTRQLEQARQHYEKSQTTLAVESDRKRLEDRFVDAQNRLAKQGTDHEAVSAINRLVEIAQTLDPGISHRTDEEAVSLCGLPSGWSLRLSSDSKHRPSEQAFPYFKPVGLRLASIVLLEGSQAVRDAAVRGIGRMAKFSIQEIEDVDWNDFERLPPGRSPMPMTKFLAETFAEATRDAEKQWLAAWGSFASGMSQLNKNLDLVDTPEWSLEQDAFPNWPSLNPNEDAAQHAIRTRKVRKTHLFPKLNYDETGNDPEWSPDYDLWSTSCVMCSFIKGNEDLLTDYLLNAAEADVAKRAAILQRQANPKDGVSLRGDVTRRLSAASQNAISTRDGLAAILRAVQLDDSQLPSEFRGSGEHQWGGERAAETQLRVTEPFPKPGINRTLALLNTINIDCSGAWLVGADLTNADVSGIRLNEANLTGAVLYLAGLNGTGMYGAYLWGAVITEARGIGTHLVSANLNGADLTMVRFPAANASSATFIEADLTMAQLPGANMNAAHLDGANIQSAYFPNAKTGRVSLHDTIVSEGKMDWIDRSAAEIERECYVCRNNGNSLDYPPGTKSMRKKAWPREGEDDDRF